jgi:hypothetical protein
MNIKNGKFGINDYISELERKVQDLEKTVEDYGNRIADASFTLYDWDGYYDYENLKGNVDELALLAEDVYSILQGKPWLETPLRERLEKRGEKSEDVEGQMVFDFDGCPAPLEEAVDSVVPSDGDSFVGDNDHGDAVPPPPPTPEDIMMRNQELTMQNIDLNARAIKAEAMCETLRAALDAVGGRDSPLLGLATNEELINELKVRIEIHWDLDYRTVNGVVSGGNALRRDAEEAQP